MHSRLYIKHIPMFLKTVTFFIYLRTEIKINASHLGFRDGNSNEKNSYLNSFED